MSRPCECGRAAVGDRTPDCCPLCWKWLNSPWWRARWETGAPPPRPPAPTPCVHLGERLTGHEREALGLDHRRDWRRCGLGLTLRGGPPGVVCRCRGCGPTCHGYKAGDGEEAD